MSSSRELRIYPPIFSTPKNGVGKIFLEPGEINKHASVTAEGKLIISEEAYPDDILAILVSIMSRREEKDIYIQNACNYLRLAISELDERAIKIHNYSSNPEEKNLNMIASNRDLHTISEKMTNYLYKKQLKYAGPKATYHELIVDEDELKFLNNKLDWVEENGKFEQFDYRYRLDMRYVFYGDLIRVTTPVKNSSYRNDGLFIFDGDKLVNLSAEWDEYGSIPPEFEIKEDNLIGPEYWIECSPCIKSIRERLDTDFDKNQSNEIYDTYFNFPGMSHNMIIFPSSEIRKKLANKVIWDGFGYSTSEIIKNYEWIVICDDEYLQTESDENKQKFIDQILNKDFAFDAPIGNYYNFNELVSKQCKTLKTGYVFSLLEKRKN